MADRRKKLSELITFESTSAELTNTDYFPVVDASAGTTKTVTFGTVRKQLVGGLGPYDDDAEASSGGVEVDQLYYDSSGNVRIRLV